MRDYFNDKLIEMKLRADRFIGRLRDEERGDTNFVSIIIIIVIVLGIAAIFREQLTGAVNSVMSQLTEFIDG